MKDVNPKLAEDINKRMFLFEDIVMLDDRSIQKFLREIDSQDLAKALQAVSPEVQNKIFQNIPEDAVKMLKEDMAYMAPVRLKDVEEAQQKIVAIIRYLDNTDEIVIPRAGKNEWSI